MKPCHQFLEGDYETGYFLIIHRATIEIAKKWSEYFTKCRVKHCIARNKNGQYYIYREPVKER